MANLKNNTAKMQDILNAVNALPEAGGKGRIEGTYPNYITGNYVSENEVVFEFPFENCIGFHIDSGGEKQIQITTNTNCNFIISSWYTLEPAKHVSSKPQSAFGLTAVKFGGSEYLFYSNMYFPSQLVGFYIENNKVRIVTLTDGLKLTGETYYVYPIYSS
jgi:hypothetical protein